MFRQGVLFSPYTEPAEVCGRAEALPPGEKAGWIAPARRTFIN
ncbi:MAG: hypothetical protein AB1453_03175 [Chloroflexota bacterium]